MKDDEAAAAPPWWATADLAPSNGTDSTSPPPPWWATTVVPTSNGWDSPSPPPPPPPPAAGPSSYDDDDLSIFHPSRHEGLHPQIFPVTKPPPSRDLVLNPRENLSHWPGEEEWLHRWWRCVMLHAKCLIGSGVEFVNSKLQLYRGGGSGCVNGGVVCSVAAVVGMLGFFVYMRRRHRREKAALFLLLLQEKDQKITLLLQQIAWMKEIIAARHGVSVPRT